MEVRFEIIDDLCTNELRVYTALLEDSELSEFEKFLNKDDKFAETHSEELDEIYSVIEKMKITGAKKYYFIAEEYSHYLPKVSNEIKDNNEKDYGIRLYCLYLRNDLIVLLNGDIKTRRRPQDCPNVSKHFDMAEKIGRKLDEMLISKDINYDNEFPFDDDFYIII